MKKTLKAIIVYYLLAALTFVGLIIAALLSDPATSMGYTDYGVISLYLVLPIASLILGFLGGGAKSYAKWGLPIYMALLTLCFTIMVFESEDWAFVGLAFAVTLVGVTIRHLIRIFRKKRKMRRNSK